MFLLYLNVKIQSLVEIKLQIRNGNLTNALKEIDQVPISNQDLMFRVYKSVILELKGRYDEALTEINFALDDIERMGKMVKFAAIVAESYILWRLSKYENVDIKIEFAFQMLSNFTKEEKISVKEWEGRLYNLKGIQYWNKGQLDQGLENIEKAIEIFVELNHTLYLGFGIYNIGFLYWAKGELDTALKKVQKALELFTLIDNIQYIGSCQMQMANLYINQGMLNEALNYYNRALDTAINVDNKPDIAMLLTNIGATYSRKGEYYLAHIYHSKSLELNEENGNQKEIAICMANLGTINYKLGQIELSLEFYNKSLQIRQKLKNPIDISKVLYSLITTYVALNHFDEAESHLNHLKTIRNKNKNRRISLNYQLAKAIHHKYNGKKYDQNVVLKLLRSIVDGEIIDHELTMFASIHLCDLMIIEKKLPHDLKSLNDIKLLINNLTVSAESNQNVALTAEMKLLQAKIALGENNPILAKKFLDEGQQITDEKGMLNLSLQISNYYDLLIDTLVVKDYISMDENSDFKTNNFNEIEELFAQVLDPRIDKKLDIVPETAQIFIVTDINWNIVYQKIFGDFETQNDEIVGNIFRVINQLVNTSGNEITNFQRIRFEKFNCIFEKRNNLNYFYAYLGHSYTAIQRLRSLIDSIDVYSILVRDLSNSSKPKVIVDPSDVDIIVDELFDFETNQLDYRDQFNKLATKEMIEKFGDYKSFFHPIRMAIMRLLDKYYSLSRVQLRDILNISSGNLSNHLKIMSDKRFILQEHGFVNESPRLIISVTILGTKMFNSFRSLVDDILK